MNIGKEKREGPEFLSPIYELALNQFLAAAEKLDLDDNLIERMRSPDRTMLVTLPVKMDDGKVKNFYGYRVQHNTSMGPGKGGIRYHPDVNLGEISALAMWMTWKGGLMNLPLGGAKGGVTCNPKEMSMGELERLTRRYTYAIFPLIGPDVDVPAPDVGTNAQTMAWIMDSYSVHTGFHTTGVVTGKPPITGGSKGRDEATGQGVFFNVMDAAKKIGLNVENATVAVQGFGNVGHHAAKFLHKIGAKVIAISNSHEGAYNSAGIPVEDLFQHSKQTRDLASFKDMEKITNEELLTLKCDILIPAALENQVNDKNANKVNCKIYAEGANGPTTLEADKILEDKGIFIIPDILCNSGGVVVSYFEWVQDLQNFFWDEGEIEQRMRKILKTGFTETCDLSAREKVGMRLAALMKGVYRVAETMRLRGFYP